MDCLVCLEEIKEKATKCFTCKKVFHASCIDTWFDSVNSRKNICPHCMSRFKLIYNPFYIHFTICKKIIYSIIYINILQCVFHYTFNSVFISKYMFILCGCCDVTQMFYRHFFSIDSGFLFLFFESSLYRVIYKYCLKKRLPAHIEYKLDKFQLYFIVIHFCEYIFVLITHYIYKYIVCNI